MEMINLTKARAEAAAFSLHSMNMESYADAIGALIKGFSELCDLNDNLTSHRDELRKQLAYMTADRDRLLGIMCEIAGSKSLTATPTQFYQHLQRVASDATITNPEALAATEPRRRNADDMGNPPANAAEKEAGK